MAPEHIAAYRASFRGRLQDKYRTHEKRRQQLMQTVLRCAHKTFTRFPSIQRAYLFGSIIRPREFHAESDVDIGIEGANAEEYFGAWAAFEELLPQVVIDIRDVDALTSFGQAIMRTGIMIYERTDTSPSS
ncbi:MAG: nucleotidyltransferase domain-containing protein [Caldilineaceae bacterium]